jgi:thiamine transport system ATP-binding protein
MLEVRDLVVRYDGVTAVDGVDLCVGGAEVVSVLGPSGSGKSTLLRAVAGLEPPAAGVVTWDGVDLCTTPPHRRGFGLMFQDHALFPHRDVAGNVAFGLQMQGIAPAAARTRAEELLGLVGLPGLGERPVRSLSGGEQQRVALARALAPDPRLLMLDEPLGALDRALRDHLVDELRAIFGRRERAVLLVTHDHEEAFALAHRVVVLRDGRVEQDADAPTVWRRPATAFVARFLGYNVTAAFGPLLAIRPDNLTLVEEERVAPAGARGVGVVVVDRTFRRDHFRVRVRTAAGELLDVAVPDGAGPEPGRSAIVGCAPGAAVPLPG